MARSADPNSGPGDPTGIGIGTGTRDNTSMGSQAGIQEADLGNSGGGKDFEIGQSGISNPPQNAGLRRSSRTNKGKISRF